MKFIVIGTYGLYGTYQKPSGQILAAHTTTELNVVITTNDNSAEEASNQLFKQLYAKKQTSKKIILGSNPELKDLMDRCIWHSLSITKLE